jgi:cyclic-di-GMP phosphodiesterase TipF (flagellum assembly factor)
VLATLVANQAVTSSLSFAIAQPQFKALTPVEKRALTEFHKAGAGFALVGATSLRFDFAELEGLGFTTARFDASQFLNRPESFTDFHTADIAPYAKRFEIELCATGVLDEQQLLSLFEDGIALVQGPHIGRPGPVRADLVIERPREPERRQA